MAGGKLGSGTTIATCCLGLVRGQRIARLALGECRRMHAKAGGGKARRSTADREGETSALVVAIRHRGLPARTPRSRKHQGLVIDSWQNALVYGKFSVPMIRWLLPKRNLRLRGKSYAFSMLKHYRSH